MNIEYEWFTYTNNVNGFRRHIVGQIINTKTRFLCRLYDIIYVNIPEAVMV